MNNMPIKQNKLKFFAVWSNLFYLVPLVFSLYFLLWSASIMIALLFIFSLGFHIYKTKWLSYADTIFSYAVIMMCAYLIFIGRSHIFVFLSLGLIVIAGLFIRFFIEDGTRDDRSHGFWHVSATIAITLCILGYTL
jgi:hypothetical protein